jgi:Fructose-bisphosphate aldolase class-II
MRFSTAAALLLSSSAVYGFVPASQPSSSSSLYAATETATAKKVRHEKRHTQFVPLASVRSRDYLLTIPSCFAPIVRAASRFLLLLYLLYLRYDDEQLFSYLQAFAKLPATVKAGVVTGQGLKDLLNHAKATGFAIPGVNIVGTNSINSCMEAAAKYGGPIMVTFSKGGGQFIAGKSLKNDNDDASIAGCIAGAKHVREVAKLYNVPVVLHTDHCQKAWLPWFDGLMSANEEYYKSHGEPLFSSHMLDLSEEPLEENIAICKKYLERMAKFDCLLEFELGVTGGEEDGVGTFIYCCCVVLVVPLLFGLFVLPFRTNNLTLTASLILPHKPKQTIRTRTVPVSTPNRKKSTTPTRNSARFRTGCLPVPHRSAMSTVSTRPGTWNSSR